MKYTSKGWGKTGTGTANRSKTGTATKIHCRCLLNTNTEDTHFINVISRHITGFMLMVSAKRTRKSIVGVQDRDTLIEQSHIYSNRTYSRYTLII